MGSGPDHGRLPPLPSAQTGRFVSQRVQDVVCCLNILETHIDKHVQGRHMQEAAARVWTLIKTKHSDRKSAVHTVNIYGFKEANYSSGSCRK